MVETSKRWFDALPKDLQEIIDRDAAAESAAINPFAAGLWAKARKSWVDGGGELIGCRRGSAAMMTTLSNVGEDIAKTRPQLYEAYKVVTPRLSGRAERAEIDQCLRWRKQCITGAGSALHAMGSIWCPRTWIAARARLPSSPRR